MPDSKVDASDDYTDSAGTPSQDLGSPEPFRALSEVEQLRYAIDQSAIVATTDVTGRIKYVNDKFCQISKYSREELIGRDHGMINSGYHSAEYIRNLWRTIARGDVWRGEFRNRAKDGTFYWVDTTIVPFLDERRKPWQYIALRYDITERKLQEQRLRNQAALISLGEMAAVIAHEVRNPLAGIRGGVQLLESTLPPASEGAEFVADIVGRIDSLNNVIGDLLAFARFNELRMGPVDMAPLLSDIVKSLRYDPALQGITWKVEAPDDLTIEADVDQFRLVLTNLTLNAAQATDRGEVRLTATTDAFDRCVITVTDQGAGIPEDLRERVFEPFFTTKHRGTGLGLPMAKRVIEAHGGRLDLEPAPHRGTVARVAVPIKRPT